MRHNYWARGVLTWRMRYSELTPFRKKLPRIPARHRRKRGVYVHDEHKPKHQRVPVAQFDANAISNQFVVLITARFFALTAFAYGRSDPKLVSAQHHAVDRELYIRAVLVARHAVSI